MKPSIKNTIMIGMTVVLIGTSAVTISYAGERNGAQPQFSQSQQFRQPQSGNPFDGFGKNGNSQNGGNLQQPQMPDNQQGNNSQQPPQMPDNQQGNNSQQPPQAPDSSKDNGGNQQQTPGDSQENSDSKQKGTSASDTELNIIQTSASESDTQSTADVKMQADNFRHGLRFNFVSGICYMFAAVQIAIILAVLIYLIISKMNRKSFNEVIAGMRNKQ
jgi:hypothetical protein